MHTTKDGGCTIAHTFAIRQRCRRKSAIAHRFTARSQYGKKTRQPEDERRRSPETRILVHGGVIFAIELLAARRRYGMLMRIGIGYDAHRLVPGRPLILGGVRIECERGLEGHSDADVLVHAVCDALLGAVAAGDIGTHFPDTDPAWAGIGSLVLLSKSADIVAERGFSIENIDATLLIEAPKIAPYRRQMVDNIAEAAGLPPDRVSVKATTNEGLGWIGRGEGIGAMAVALLVSLDRP